MTQKTARFKLLIMRNGAPPDVGPPLSPGACEVRSPRPPNGHLWAPRVDRLTYLSGTERQGCSWGACRDSESRAAAQPPGACARTQKVAWRHCCGVQIAAPRCPRAVSSPSVPPGPLTDQAAAKDRLIHGPAGRQQVATLPSSSAAEPPFDAPSVAMLSASLASLDSESTTCMEC